MHVIKLVNISKKYRSNVVLNGVNYNFKRGRTYLLLGPNGSGKSTLIKVLLDFIIYQGSVVKNGNVKVSYIPEAINFPDYVTVDSFLTTLAKMRNISDIDNQLNPLLKEWELEHAKNKLIVNLSKGMKQKLLIINSLLCDSDIYIFDEPLNGLDYQMQQKFLSKIMDLKSQNKTIIISTHYVSFYKSSFHIILKIKDGKIYEKII